MYNNKPSSGPRRNFRRDNQSSGYSNNNRRPGGNQGFRGNNQRRGRGFNGNEKIDVSRFIKKSTAVVVADEYIAENKFSDFDINPVLKQNIIQKGYSAPTHIQDKVIPYLIETKDVIGIANTGTGKTAAFLIPLIDKIYKNREEKALIIVPTRELAVQIRDELVSLNQNINLKSALIIGGADIRKQIQSLKANNSIVIGTPGRLKDLINRRALDITRFTNIVLDEVDHMMDMGFLDDVKFLIAHMGSVRHSMFFSATMKPKIEEIARTFLKDPVLITVKTNETSDNVDQDVVKVTMSNKVDILDGLLKDETFKKVLIFGRTKHGVEKLSLLLAKKGYKAVSIHGDKSQFKRQNALNEFKNNKATILVATDVAARGLDIKDITHVINYDLPATYDDYVHRIGRTGRGHKKGIAITFVE